MLQIGTAAPGHHRARQHAVHLDAVHDAAVGEGLGKRHDRSVDRADRRIGRPWGISAELPDISTTEPPAALSAGQAAMVNLRAP